MGRVPSVMSGFVDGVGVLCIGSRLTDFDGGWRGGQPRARKEAAS